MRSLQQQFSQNMEKFQLNLKSKSKLKPKWKWKLKLKTNCIEFGKIGRNFGKMKVDTWFIGGETFYEKCKKTMRRKNQLEIFETNENRFIEIKLNSKKIEMK